MMHKNISTSKKLTTFIGITTSIIFYTISLILISYILISLFFQDQLPFAWTQHWKPGWQYRWGGFTGMLLAGLSAMVFWLPLSGWLGARLVVALLNRDKAPRIKLRAIFFILLFIPNVLYCLAFAFILLPAFIITDVSSIILPFLAVILGNVIPTACFIALILEPLIRRLSPQTVAALSTPDKGGMRMLHGVPEWIFMLGGTTAFLFGAVRYVAELEMNLLLHDNSPLFTMKYSILYVASGMNLFLFVDYWLGLLFSLAVIPGWLDRFRPFLPKPNKYHDEIWNMRKKQQQK